LIKDVEKGRKWKKTRISRCSTSDVTMSATDSGFNSYISRPLLTLQYLLMGLSLQAKVQ
jgi:hypothetical protein